MAEGTVHGIACGKDGCRHFTMTQEDLRAILDSADASKAKRAEDMPTEQDAINAMFSAHLRLRELGWKEAIYAPEHTPLDVIEPGSTGIHYATRDEERRFWIHDDDTWPSRPTLFRLRAAEHSDTEPLAGTTLVGGEDADG